MRTHSLWPGACLALLCASAAKAGDAPDTPAPNADMRFVAAGVQRDARHDQTATALLSLPVGQRGWAQIGGGQNRDVQAGVARRPVIVTGGVGYLGDGWQASLSASHRGDGGRLSQSDAAALLEWRREGWTAGLDGSWRDARQTGTASASAPLSGPTDVPVVQHVRGGGIGLHGSVRPTATFSVYASAMHYHYQVTTRQDGTAAGTGLPLLAALAAPASFVGRDESTLSRSAGVGASQRFERVTLSGEFLADRVLGTAGTERTVQLKAAVDVAPGWTVTPAVGRTHGNAYGDVGFAGLALSRAW